jgi:hypothetical protein
MFAHTREMRRILTRMLDENEFLSLITGLSLTVSPEHPYVFSHGEEYQ